MTSRIDPNHPNTSGMILKEKEKESNKEKEKENIITHNSFSDRLPSITSPIPSNNSKKNTKTCVCVCVRTGLGLRRKLVPKVDRSKRIGTRKPFVPKVDPLAKLKITPTDLPISLRYLAKNKPPKVSAPIEDLLTVWYDHGLKRHLNRTSLTFREDLDKLKRFRSGTLFKNTELEEKEKIPFSPAEFEIAVEGFALMASHPAYWPEDKTNFKRMTISAFLYNPRSPKMKSWFLHCLNNPPRLLGCEGNSELTQAMMKLYVEEIGDGFIFDLTPQEIHHFVRGTELAEKIFKSNPHIPKYLISTPQKKAELIFDALYSYQTDKPLTPGWFSNPLTYNKTLIDHLKIKMANNVIPIKSTYRYR